MSACNAHRPARSSLGARLFCLEGVGYSVEFGAERAAFGDCPSGRSRLLSDYRFGKKPRHKKRVLGATLKALTAIGEKHATTRRRAKLVTNPSDRNGRESVPEHQ